MRSRKFVLAQPLYIASSAPGAAQNVPEKGAEGSDSVAEDPPIATVSGFDRTPAAVQDAVAVLRSPQWKGVDITFDVTVPEGEIPVDADRPATVFIDIIGLPSNPKSFAGAARRAAAYPDEHPYDPMPPPQ